MDVGQSSLCRIAPLLPSPRARCVLITPISVLSIELKKPPSNIPQCKPIPKCVSSHNSLCSSQVHGFRGNRHEGDPEDPGSLLLTWGYRLSKFPCKLHI